MHDDEIGIDVELVHRLLRDQHPALARLEPMTMATAGIALPLHDGAERAFESSGVSP